MGRFGFLGRVLYEYIYLVMLVSPGIFSFPSLFLNPSIESTVVFFTGIVFGLLFYVTLDNVVYIRLQKNLLSGYLSLYSGCGFHKFQIEDFSKGSNLANEIHKSDLHRIINIDKLKLNIIVYVVKRGDSQIVPSQLVAFISTNGLLDPSYIFVRDKPEEITPVGKFFLYHEISHASYQGSITRQTNYRWILFIVTIFWAIINLKYSILSVLILAFFVLLFGIVALYYFKMKNSHFLEEIAADQYALSFLSENELQSLADYLNIAGKLPRNPKLSESLNLKRSKVLIEEIEKIKNKQDLYKYPPVILSTVLFYLLGLLAILTPVMGFFSSHSPSLILVSCNCLPFFLPVCIYIVSGVIKYLRKDKIESYLIKN